MSDFFKYAKSVISEYPELNHSWEIEGETYKLDFPVSLEEGFGVHVAFDDHAGMIFTDIALHFDFNFETGFLWEMGSYSTIKPVPESLMKFVLDLLSPKIRVREYIAGKSGYKWDLECLEEGNWQRLHTMSLIFWNYFGKRSQKIYQNSILPNR